MAATKLAERPADLDPVLLRIKRVNAVLAAPPKKVVSVDGMSHEDVWRFARRAAVLVCANEELVVPGRRQHEFKLLTYLTDALPVATIQRHQRFNVRLLSVLLQCEVFEPGPTLARGQRFGSLLLTPTLADILNTIK